MRLTEAAIRRIVRESIVNNLSKRRINEADDDLLGDDDLGGLFGDTSSYSSRPLSFEDVSMPLEAREISDSFRTLGEGIDLMISLLREGKLSEETLRQGVEPMSLDILPPRIGGKRVIDVLKLFLADAYQRASGKSGRPPADVSVIQKYYGQDQTSRQEIYRLLSGGRDMAMQISAAIGKAPSNLAAASQAESMLDRFSQQLPLTAAAMNFDGLRQYLRKGPSAGLGSSGYESYVEAVAGVLGGVDIAPSPDLIAKSGPALDKILDGNMVLRPGSSGDVVELSQRLLAIHLDAFSRRLSPEPMVGLRSSSDERVADALSMSPEEIVRTMKSGRPVDPSAIAVAAGSAASKLKRGFGKKYDESTALATMLFQAYVGLVTKYGSMSKGGVYRVPPENITLMDGVIGRQTMSAMLKGDFAAAASRVEPVRSAPPRIAAGAEKR